MKELSEIYGDTKRQFYRWGDAEPNFRPTSQSLIRELPEAAEQAKQEQNNGGLSEISKQRLADLLGIAEQCLRHLKQNSDTLLSNQLTAAVWSFKSNFFDLKPQILPPMIDCDASESFCFHVREVVETLPLDVQKKIGAEAYFMELSPKTVHGFYAESGTDRRKICIAGGLDAAELRSTIAHECAHLILNHTTGGHINESAARELAANWGFQN